VRCESHPALQCSHSSKEERRSLKSTVEVSGSSGGAIYIVSEVVMWLAELVGISIVGGVILGVSWRLVENYLEKRQSDNQ
jgi:hypothetical protein